MQPRGITAFKMHKAYRALKGLTNECYTPAALVLALLFTIIYYKLIVVNLCFTKS